MTSLARSMRHRGASEAALLEENLGRCAPPLPESEVRRIATSVAKYAPADPSDEPFHPTDLGNAKRLAMRHSHELRYCHPWRRWLTWDGRRWRIDDTGAVYRMAKETVANIYAEATEAADSESRKQLAKWAVQSESDKHITAMLSQARSEPGIPVVPDQLDTDPWLLNVLNDTIDLRTGQRLTHDPERMITKLAPVCRRSAIMGHI